MGRHGPHQPTFLASLSPQQMAVPAPGGSLQAPTTQLSHCSSDIDLEVIFLHDILCKLNAAVSHDVTHTKIQVVIQYYGMWHNRVKR